MNALSGLVACVGKLRSARAEEDALDQAWRDAVANRKNSDAYFVEDRRASFRAQRPDPGTDTTDNGLQGT